MKKGIITAALTVLALGAFSQANESWRFGVQWGLQGNRSYFKGGMENANARFQHNSFGAAALDFVVRYDHNPHWMFMTGFGLNTFGFEFALAENYSLKKEKSRNSIIRNEYTAAEIPVMAYYKFKPNCKNAKWLVGAGLSQNMTGSHKMTKSFIKDGEGTSSDAYLNSTANVKGGTYTMLRFSVGREKVFKRGGILNASIIFNRGLREMAKAKVTYTVDGQTYEHLFGNRGNFVGFRLTYFFRPFSVSPGK